MTGHDDMRDPRSVVATASPRASWGPAELSRLRVSPPPEGASAAAASSEQIRKDVAAVGRLGAVPTLLRVLCETTGMGYAVVARVTDDSWTACAVHDSIDFGIGPGMQLALDTTLCKEVRAHREPIVIEQASRDPVYRDHPTPRLYNIESYASFPIVLPDGDCFGNLCCMDPKPAPIDRPSTRTMFARFAELIAAELADERRHEETRTALTSERAVAELREQFIAILGHDLRNPLAAVSACAHLLRRQSDEPTVIDLLERMLKSVSRMARLIDDTLDFARGRLGDGLSLHLQWSQHLGGAIDDVIDAARIAHPGRAIASSIVVDEAVRCDLPRLQQIASNLVGNAIAHGSPTGPIRVRARCDAEAIELTVWNQGEPIPVAALGKIFQPFWRQDSGRKRDGLGLGLHICAEIARAHDGTLTVASSAEDGTTFVCRLPTAGPDGAAHRHDG